MTYVFPLIRQLDTADCGLSCLMMIFKYYNKKINVRELRNQIDISKQGISLLDIKKLAKTYHIESNGKKIDIDKLYDSVKLPCILHWNQNHYVVLYKIKNNNNKTLFHIADPGKGKYRVSLIDFKKNWGCNINNTHCGILLELKPTKLFYNFSHSNLGTRIDCKFHLFSRYFKEYRSLFYQLILGLVIGSSIQLIIPFLTQTIVDVGIKESNLNFIWLILLGQSILILSRTIIDFIRRKLLLHLSTRINISLVSDFFIKLMRLPMNYFDKKHLGDLLQRIDDHRRIESFISTQCLKFVSAFLSLIALGIVLMIYNIKLFFIFVSGSSLYAIWMLLFLNKRRILDYDYFDLQSLNRNKTYELINGMQEIKLQGYEQIKRWEWEDTQVDMFKNSETKLSIEQYQEAGSIFINELKNIILTVISASLVIKGEISLGVMLSIQYIIGQLNRPVESIMDFFYRIQDAKISLERMNEIHSAEEESSKNKQIQTFDGDEQYSIAIKNLVFGYSKKNTVLNNITFNIPKGKITAIVGSSGSGKTTIIKLLLGFNHSYQGEILVGNYKLSNLDLNWWRKKCGCVMQDSYIFSESIAQNIATSNKEIDIARLHSATKLACLDDFILNLPLGYNTIIGSEGQGLSQGQRQRILIARAIYKNPSLLFLDEATNALDATNEKIIHNNLTNFYKGRTVIIAAHRLSTIMNADQIIVLDQGKIVEIGTHDNLILNNGAYYKLIKNQIEIANY